MIDTNRLIDEAVSREEASLAAGIGDAEILRTGRGARMSIKNNTGGMLRSTLYRAIPAKRQSPGPGKNKLT